MNVNSEQLTQSGILEYSLDPELKFKGPSKFKVILVMFIYIAH